MASVTEWVVHGAGPAFTANSTGQHELAARKGRVYRVFHDASLVEFDANAATARYWDIPGALSGSLPPSTLNAIGMQVGPGGKVWLATAFAGLLVRLDPGADLFTGYTLGGGAVTVAPLPHASRLRFDAKGDAWYTTNLAHSTAADRPVIGRYHPGAGQSALWELPFDNAIAMDVWPEAKAVWCSFAFATAPRTRPALCRLDISNGTLKCWFLTGGASPGHTFSAMAGDASKPKNLWLIYNDLVAVRQVVRLKVATGFCTSFKDGHSDPIDVDVDSNGNAWVANTDGRIQCLGPTAECKRATLRSRRDRALRFSLPVSIATYPVAPVSLTITTRSYAVTPAKQRCSIDYPLQPGIAIPVAGGLTTGNPRIKSPIYYSLPDVKGIGALTP